MVRIRKRSKKATDEAVDEHAQSCSYDTEEGSTLDRRESDSSTQQKTVSELARTLSATWSPAMGRRMGMGSTNKPSEKHTNGSNSISNGSKSIRRSFNNVLNTSSSEQVKTKPVLKTEAIAKGTVTASEALAECLRSRSKSLEVSSLPTRILSPNLSPLRHDHSMRTVDITESNCKEDKKSPRLGGLRPQDLSLRLTQRVHSPIHYMFSSHASESNSASAGDTTSNNPTKDSRNSLAERSISGTLKKKKSSGRVFIELELIPSGQGSDADYMLLSVRVKECRNLSSGKLGDPSVYVKVYLLPDPLVAGNIKHRTKIIKRSRNPIFPERFELRIPTNAGHAGIVKCDDFASPLSNNGTHEFSADMLSPKISDIDCVSSSTSLDSFSAQNVGIPDGEMRVMISVWTSRSTWDEFVGCTSFSIAELERRGAIEAWFYLLDKDTGAFTNQPLVDIRLENIEDTGINCPGSLSDRSNYLGNDSKSSFNEMTLWQHNVDQDILSCITKEEMNRQESLFELIMTEGGFVQDLRTMDEVFAQPLTQAGFLSTAEYDRIFSFIPILVGVHEELHGALRDRQDAQAPFINEIGDILMNYEPHLSLCSNTYCRESQAAAHYVEQRCTSDNDFMEFLQNQSVTFNCMGFSSYLLKPFQRITKYPLLLRAVVAVTPEGHVDYTNIMRVFEWFTQLLQRINASQDNVVGGGSGIDRSITMKARNTHIIHIQRWWRSKLACRFKSIAEIHGVVSSTNSSLTKRTECFIDQEIVPPMEPSNIDVPPSPTMISYVSSDNITNTVVVELDVPCSNLNSSSSRDAISQQLVEAVQCQSQHDPSALPLVTDHIVIDEVVDVPVAVAATDVDVDNKSEKLRDSTEVAVEVVTSTTRNPSKLPRALTKRSSSVISDQQKIQGNKDNVHFSRRSPCDKSKIARRVGRPLSLNASVETKSVSRSIKRQSSIPLIDDKNMQHSKVTMTRRSKSAVDLHVSQTKWTSTQSSKKDERPQWNQNFTATRSLEKPIARNAPKRHNIPIAKRASLIQ